ncbi:MAG: hypothetical protein ABJF23_03295 [Bryobacteraceae bacterium]
MSFLDALENNLKSLEAQDERDPVRAAEIRRQREDDRARALASAPVAEQLRNGNFTAALLDHAVRIGHSQRTKVQITWIDTTLRLQAKERRLDLKPTVEGVLAIFSDGGSEIKRHEIDLAGDPEALATEWLAVAPE